MLKHALECLTNEELDELLPLDILTNPDYTDDSLEAAIFYEGVRRKLWE